MNIIEQLHQFVTPKVLELVKDQAGDNTSKTGLLSSLYGILGARLSDPNAIQRLEALEQVDEVKDGTKVLNALLQDEQGNSQLPLLVRELSTEHNLPQETVSATVTSAAPLAFAQFKNLADGNPIAVYLQDKMADFAALLPSWATALLPAGLLAGTAGLAGSAISGVSNLASSAGNLASKAVSGVGEVVSDVADGAKSGAEAVVSGAKDAVSSVSSGAKEAVGSVATHVNHQVSNATKATKNEGNFLKTLLPIIGLLIFAGLVWLLLRSCQHNTTPVASPTPAAQTATASSSETASATTAAALVPATLSLATDNAGNAIYSCQAEAGSEGVFASIRETLSSLFGSADKCEMNVVKGHAEQLAVGEHLPKLLGLLKGVPNASINLNDKTVRFNAADEASLAKLIEAAKGILPADFVVEAEPKLDAQTAVANSIDTAKSAIENLTDTTSEDTANALVRALNLQIINFATASNDIPAENKAVLDLAAEKLAQMPNAQLKIIGHTDDKGNYKSNKALSERRAKAVHDYLVAKGVPDAQLETFGASSDEPIASNATEQGRFQNRRIEFALIQANGDVTRVGNANPADNASATDSTPASGTTASN